MQSRQFTLQQATGLLGWLESKFAELDPYREELRRHREQDAALSDKGRSNGSQDVGEELHRVQNLVEEMEKSVQDIMGQISDRGILVQDLERGLVDFPSRREGREVFLCWLRGEPEIRFWHEIETGFAGRQPL